MTPVGEVRGLQAVALIGPAGGELTSTDGRVTVTVPPGALTGTQELGIVEITSHAPGAVGRSYRITPHGLATPVPMTLRLRYHDSVLRAAAPGSLGWPSRPRTAAGARSRTRRTTPPRAR